VAAAPNLALDFGHHGDHEKACLRAAIEQEGRVLWGRSCHGEEPRSAATCVLPDAILRSRDIDMTDAERRAQARLVGMDLRKGHLGEPEVELGPVFGAEAISLVHPPHADELCTRRAAAAELSARANSLRVHSQAFAMIDLPQDFRDLLLARHDGRAEFVVVGGHAVAYHGHPRATKDLDVLVRATDANAKLVYRALAAFGAPLSVFEVSEDAFAAYDGVLQMGSRPCVSTSSTARTASPSTRPSPTTQASKSTDVRFPSSAARRC